MSTANERMGNEAPGRKIRVFHVDAFTRVPFQGNPAGVVLDADCLSDGEMQQIARELNLSETAFVLSPRGADHDVRLRFFTPTVEVPSCGHATIAAHHVRAEILGLRHASLVQLTGSGLMSIDLLPDGEDVRIRMTQGPIELDPPLPEPIVKQIHAALGVAEGDADGALPVQVVSTGHSKVLVPLRSRRALQAVKPDLTVLTALSRTLGCNGYFAFTFDQPDPGALTQARMFAPAIGIAEDPVTGNGQGPLGAYLVHHGRAAHDGTAFRFRGAQGDATGRSGYVDVAVDIANDSPLRVCITGDAVILYRTELRL